MTNTMQALLAPPPPAGRNVSRWLAVASSSAWMRWAGPGLRAVADCCGAVMLLTALAADPEPPATPANEDTAADQRESAERQGLEQERLRRQIAERRHEQRLRARQAILSEMLKEVEIRREYLMGRSGTTRMISGTVGARDERFALVRDGSYVFVVVLLTYRFRRWLFRGPYAWIARRRARSATTAE